MSNSFDLKSNNKTIVFGYHNMGVIGIQSLLKNNIDVATVFTHKDDKNENIWFKSVVDYCSLNSIPYYYSEELNNKEMYNLITQIIHILVI